MQQKAFTLLNKGMNRDLSISKAGESSAYENHNIRVLARDHDTLLSVTNESGNKAIALGSNVGFVGELVGWNVLNNHVILFTHDNDSPDSEKDRIYRVDYEDGRFVMLGEYKDGQFKDSSKNKPLFVGNLGFDLEHPIESVVYFETEDIQKVYWVDGKNVMRFMNFMADDAEMERWGGDNTYFDSNRAANFSVNAVITKDNSGNTRANGITQYLLTYYNKHGQETGYVWVSDLVYLSPVNNGGSADETNSNKVTIKLSNLDKSFTNFRVYSIFRSSLNGTAVAYIVQDGETSTGEAVVIDDAAHLIADDPSKLLYLGSQAVKAGTLTHKDQTLFLGDLQSIGKKNYDALESAIEAMRGTQCVSFQYSNGSYGDISDIPYYEDTGTYNYQSQLNLTSSQILSFKGGEKYRFALTFRRKDGTTTEAFWIGDYENTLYPVIDVSSDVIKRIVAKCTVPASVISAARDCGFETAQLMIAEATYADRSVKAQGIINPTMFNVWDRYNNRLYAQASWISRPRNSGFAWKHFEPVHNATSSTGEIQCNYWEEDTNPTPYYRRSGGMYVDSFDGLSAGDYRMILYVVRRSGAYYWCQVWLLTADVNIDSFVPSVDADELDTLINDGVLDKHDYEINLERTGMYQSPRRTDSAESLYPIIKAACKDELGLDVNNYVIDESTFINICDNAGPGDTVVYCRRMPGSILTDVLDAINTRSGWENTANTASRNDVNYVPSYYRKHLMFVDENIVTLDSPEISYEAVSFDNAENYKFRIVGVAKITNTTGDYTVDASPGKLSGENLVREKFAGNIDGIISWPLWKEYGLKEKKSTEENPIRIPSNIKKRTSEHYDWLEDTVLYWLHMWNHSGKINGYTDSDNSDYSNLKSKVFANLRYSYDTIYNSNSNYEWSCNLPSGSLRLYNYTSSQYVGMAVGGKRVFYNANIEQSLMPPGSHEYKILFSKYSPDTSLSTTGDLAYLYTDAPVQLNYLSSAHAVIELPSSVSGNAYSQTILPYINDTDSVSIQSGAILPWLSDSGISYSIQQSRYNWTKHSLASALYPDDKYLFVGEIYYDFTGNDTRYGDVKNNRFVVAGPQYTLTQLEFANIMYANQGDTYFQRWDCLKTKPAAKTDATNGVIDITSVMLETHINIDGRTDKQREVGYIASIKTEEFGSLNPVYSQQNNYFAQRDLDEDFNQDVYGANITWTLEKHDSAEIDEWSHITLANTLKLDGDKGDCRALRRFQNSIIAFQDKGIAEILFNSRTQLTTTDGVPVELANSGKVDGKRYITNKYGCSNKWSIVEGKAALYFIDNINKAFCAFNGNVESVSTRLNFDVWFRRDNNNKTWNPKDWNNVVSFYDRIHSDVYLVTDKVGDEACLVYNENLGAFTSFFDYAKVPMMTNVGDRFISYRDGLLWGQNEGFYCNFFGEQKDFWVNYRVTPDPYGDKIWTNIDYRADFYHILDSQMADNVPESSLINADSYGFINDLYKENETFTSYRIWDEYQTTGDVPVATNTSQIDPVRKKFRIWRITIPRALKHDTNKHGLDRIRNPWVNIEFRKKMTDNRYLMQLHDIVVKYFE